VCQKIMRVRERELMFIQNDMLGPERSRKSNITRKTDIFGDKN
jgi:hypothetical protein